MSFFWNLVLFPEFGGTYLGNSSVNAFNEIHKDLDDAINFFVSLGQTAMGADSNSDDGDAPQINAATPHRIHFTVSLSLHCPNY